jgi:hypothetical protein
MIISAQMSIELFALVILHINTFNRTMETERALMP